jgi:hypothetical protein
MRRSGILEQFPREQIREIQKVMRGMPLDQGPMNAEPAPAPEAGGTPLFGVPAEVPEVEEVPLFGVPVDQGSLMPSIQAPPRPQGPVNPALLGSNPMDQAANAQIAARLQGS